MNLLKITLGLTFLFLWNSSFAQDDLGIYNMKVDSVKIDSLYRNYTFFIPKNVKEKPKLVFVLHGSTMTVKAMLAVTGYEFNRIADSLKNFIVVYPQGYENYWNDCRKSATYKANTLNINEMEFIKNIVLKIESDTKIKPESIFVAGFSNGGQLVYKLAKENPDYFKGFAAISANIPIESNDDCFSTKKAVSMLIANGTTDPINPYNGGGVAVDDGKNRGKVISTLNTVQYWKDLLHCNGIIEKQQELNDINKDDSSTVTVYDYKCLKCKKNVEFIKINNGGHILPNPHFNHWPESLGNVNKDINLPKLILDFFESL